MYATMLQDDDNNNNNKFSVFHCQHDHRRTLCIYNIYTVVCVGRTVTSYRRDNIITLHVRIHIHAT